MSSSDQDFVGARLHSQAAVFPDICIDFLQQLINQFQLCSRWSKPLCVCRVSGVETAPSISVSESKRGDDGWAVFTDIVCFLDLICVLPPPPLSALINLKSPHNVSGINQLQT